MRLRDVAEIAHFFAGYDYLGFDLSLTGTGIAARNDTHWASATVSPPVEDNDKGSGRLAWFHDCFTALLQYRYKQVTVEGYSFGSKFSKSHRLGEQGGLFRLAAYKAGHNVLEISPKGLCMIMGGTGTIPKPKRKAMVLENFGVETDTPDEADAVVLAQASMMAHKRIFSNNVQLDAIDKGVYLGRIAVAPSSFRSRCRKK